MSETRVPLRPFSAITSMAARTSASRRSTFGAMPAPYPAALRPRLGRLAVAVELDRLGRERRVAEDDVGRLLRGHHHRRVDVAVGDVREHRGVHDAQALRAA